MQLIVDKLEKSFGVQEVFKDVSFMIAKGEKIGLVGVNGSGKSTLVKCLLRPDYADRGTVSFEPGINVGYVEQGFGSIGRESVWDFMLKANPEILSLRQKLAELEQASASGECRQLLFPGARRRAFSWRRLWFLHRIFYCWTNPRTIWISV